MRRHSIRSFTRRGYLLIAIAAVALLAVVAAAGLTILRGDGTTTETVAGISLIRPDDWTRQGSQDAATFSPFTLDGQPPGASEEGWNQIISALGSNTSTLVGVYVQDHGASAFQSTNLETLKGAIAGSLSSSRTNLQAPTNSDQFVDGRRATVLDGDLRPWGSTDSLRIRSYVIAVDETLGRSVHVMFFGAPAAFEESEETFAKVLASIRVSS